MRVDDGRFAMRVAMRQPGDLISANVRVDSVDIPGPVTARRAERTVTFSLWNRGMLLEGDGTIGGPCAEGQH